MPGPIVHLIVQQRMPSYLSELGGQKGRKYADLLNADVCSPYAAFGSMGPDFLFFSTREYGNAIGDFVNFIFKIYDAIEPFVNFYKTTIEPVANAIENAILALLPDDLVALINQIGDTAQLLSDTIVASIGRVITSQVDLFYPFYPKIQQGAAEKDWYWFDFLHYRRTGRFCSTMWKLAAGDADLQRYCLGYASHIATDVVGHPFVNAIVGGPYRNHWHRHKLVENWIDAYARRHYDELSSVYKCLNIDSKDHYLSHNIAGSYYSRLCEFPGQKMPPKLSAMFVKALDETFAGRDAILHPPMFNPADLDSTYRLWLRWFERSTSIGQALPPTPVGPPGSVVAGLVSDYVSGLKSIWGGGGGPSGGSSSGGFNVLAIFAAIGKFIANLAQTVAYTVKWIVTHAVEIIALPVSEAIQTIRWLLYQIQKGVYDIYDNARFAMVLGGYLFPDARDLDKLPWGRAFTNTSFAHWTGGPAVNFLTYPRKRQAYAFTGATALHLLSPSTLPETLSAEAMPRPFFGQNPEAFISGHFPYDPRIEALYKCKDDDGPTFDFTRTVDQSTWTTPQLGSALSLCGRLIGNHLEALPNFNLDGDRGYGYKTWRVDRVNPAVQDAAPLKIETNPVNVTYMDA